MISRDSKGRFAKRKWFLWLALIATAFIALHVHFSSWYDKEIRYEAAIPVVYASETMEAKVEEMKDSIIEEIAQCESGNAPEERALVVYDNNKAGTLKGKHIASIGVMKFKVATVQAFYKELHGKELSNLEATHLALDNEKSKALAKDAIMKIKGALWHWTCATDEMATKVKIIRELEQ